MRDIALILEGRDQARDGHRSSLDAVVARFKARHMLPADFDLAAAEAGARGE